MPSPADRGARIRAWLEQGAQAIGIAIIAWLLVDALRGARPPVAEQIDATELPAALARWSTVADPTRIHLRVNHAVAPVHRDWLAALGATGVAVSWEGDSVLAVAATLDAIADPGGGTRVAVAAPRGTMVRLEDDLGALDSIVAGTSGARFLTQSPLTQAHVRAGRLIADGVLRDSVRFGRILILGGVGWESGMLTAALEERGWLTDVRLSLSPKGDVKQGPETAPDTGRYSAVIVLDTTAKADLARLARYVRDGGGAILAARTLSASPLAGLRAGTIGRVVEAVEPFDRELPEPRRSLALTAIRTGPDVVALEQRDQLVAVAARRVDRGRVTIIGYEDSWRWRMAGNDGSLEEHRAWWASLVAGVARVERLDRREAGSAEEAPLARLVERLGPPGPAPDDLRATRTFSYGWLLAALAGAFLAAWLSRRLRGVP